MAQQSMVSYFGSKKRSAADELMVNKAKKVLILDTNCVKAEFKSINSEGSTIKHVFSENNNSDCKLSSKDAALEQNHKILCKNLLTYTGEVAKPRRKLGTPRISRVKKFKNIPHQGNIQQLLTNMEKKDGVFNQESAVTPLTSFESEKEIRDKSSDSKDDKGKRINLDPPSTPTKKLNAMDKVNFAKEPTFSELQQKLSRSSRLAELKASMARFKHCASKLEEAEKKTAQIKQSPTLKNFKSLELEVHLSPQKIHSPEKAYLSPKKDASVRKNLFNTFSPTKSSCAVTSASPQKPIAAAEKSSLTLPFKYRYLAEIFRAIDTICQIIYNRKETITFKKLKAAVEEMLKRNFTEKHLGQIKCLYPDAFSYQQEKLRIFGVGTREEHWELVLIPEVKQESITSELLLERRRKLFKILIEKVKDYHQEFLLTLEPSMEIPRDKITRWHPLFDIERIPDIEPADLPQPPNEDKLLTGKEVLEKARSMFSCNTRMERALEKLKEFQVKNAEASTEKPAPPTSVLKGIPKALLEKVRQKQAAKALESMTRSTDKEKELQLYTRLPEIARFTRNLYVSEKKSVLPVDTVIDKLSHSCRTFLIKTEMEQHLKTIAKEVPGWLVFHNIRNNVFIKLSKNADISVVMNKLDLLAKQKSET